MASPSDTGLDKCLDGFDEGTRKFILQARARASAAATPTVEGFRTSADGFRSLIGPAPRAVECSNAAGTPKSMELRLYTPTDPDPGLVIYVHGGGWVFGDLDLIDPVAGQLAHSFGRRVTAFSYRKAPESTFPTAHDDVLQAFEWILAHRFELADVSSPVHIIGDSAGANMAMSACLSLSEEQRRAIGSVSLIYPVVAPPGRFPSYVENARGYGMTADSIEFFWNTYVTDRGRRSDPRIDLLAAEYPAGMPPVLVVTADKDTLRDEGLALARRIEGSKNKVQHLNIPHQVHGFLWFDAISTASSELRQSIKLFLDRGHKTAPA
jgi:acetyl esterase